MCYESVYTRIKNITIISIYYIMLCIALTRDSGEDVSAMALGTRRVIVKAVVAL